MQPVEQPAVADDPWIPQPWTVRRVTRETADTVTLEIEGADEHAVSDAAPGRFMMLYVFGAGEVPISIAGIAPPRRLVHSVRNVGAVTAALCDLAPGDTVGVRGPFGSRWPIDEQRGRDVVVAAGGIGLAPLRALVEQIVARRDDYGDVVVLHGARAPDQLLYARDVERWRASGVQVEITVDTADRTWTGHVGVVTSLIRHARFDVDEASAFLCGPEIMMRFMARELLDRGVDPERTYLTMERNMKCAIGFCGHCQLGPEFLCLDGPVFPWPRIERALAVPEL